MKSTLRALLEKKLLGHSLQLCGRLPECDLK